MPCAVSGTLRATMAPTWPRAVRFEWTDCAANLLATFHATGVDPDVQQHVDLQVRGLGAFTFSQPFSLLDMMPQAGCTP